MLKIRVIPTLLHKSFGLVKGVRFDSRRAVGSPMQAVKVYNLRNVDELVFLDVTATAEGRGPDLELIDELADECFMPLAVGGGIRSVDDVRALLGVGADKVVIGTAALAHPRRRSAKPPIASARSASSCRSTPATTRCARSRAASPPAAIPWTSRKPSRSSARARSCSSRSRTTA